MKSIGDNELFWDYKRLPIIFLFSFFIFHISLSAFIFFIKFHILVKYLKYFSLLDRILSRFTKFEIQ